MLKQYADAASEKLDDYIKSLLENGGAKSRLIIKNAETKKVLYDDRSIAEIQQHKQTQSMIAAGIAVAIILGLIVLSAIWRRRKKIGDGMIYGAGRVYKATSAVSKHRAALVERIKHSAAEGDDKP